MGTFFCSTWTTPTSSTGGAACAGLLERAKPTNTAKAAIAITTKTTPTFRFFNIWTNRVFILFSGSPEQVNSLPCPLSEQVHLLSHTGRACLCFQCREKKQPLCHCALRMFLLIW